MTEPNLREVLDALCPDDPGVCDNEIGYWCVFCDASARWEARDPAKVWDRQYHFDHEATCPWWHAMEVLDRPIPALHTRKEP